MFGHHLKRLVLVEDSLQLTIFHIYGPSKKDHLIKSNLSLLYIKIQQTVFILINHRIHQSKIQKTLRSCLAFSRWL